MKDSQFQKVGGYFGILGAHTCHHKFSQIQKDLIQIGLKDLDHHPSFTCHLEVDRAYVLVWSLHAQKWLCSCTTWCSIMNGIWLIPMRELFGIHFLCSKKDFHSKFVRKSPWNFTSVGRHCRRVNKELEKLSCQVHGESMVVKKACVTDCALCVANMLGFSR